MNIKKPGRTTAKNPDELGGVLVDYYDQLKKLSGEQSPSKIPGLKSITIATFDELRKSIGSLDGEAGPRSCIVSGRDGFQDGYEGIFFWDETLATADDNANTIRPVGRERGRWVRGLSGALIGVRVLTNGTTSYIPTPGTRDALVEGWAGGGGGGGTQATGVGQTAAGAGGGGGGYFRKRIANIGAGPFVVAIGAGGTGVNGAGGNIGGNTTFNDGVTTYTAFGGQPGGVGVPTAVLAINSGAPRGNTSTNGDINGTGTHGGDGWANGAGVISGPGGDTSLGGGGQRQAGTAAGGNGVAGTGGGGAGASAAAGAAAQTGGTGGTGLLVITELS